MTKELIWRRETLFLCQSGRLSSSLYLDEKAGFLCNPNKAHWMWGATEDGPQSSPHFFLFYKEQDWEKQGLLKSGLFVR